MPVHIAWQEMGALTRTWLMQGRACEAWQLSCMPCPDRIHAVAHLLGSRAKALDCLVHTQERRTLLAEKSDMLSRLSRASSVQPAIRGPVQIWFLLCA